MSPMFSLGKPSAPSPTHVKKKTTHMIAISQKRM